MELTVFLKMLFDASAFLTVVGYVTSLFTPVSLLLIPAMLTALACGGCYLVRDRGGLVSRLPLLLALPGFAFADTAADYVLVAVLLFYLIYVTTKRLYLNDDDDFRDIFRKLFMLSLMPCLFSAIAVQIDVLNSILLPYIFIMAVCGVALLRILRHNREIIDSPAFKLSNMLTVAGVCGLALLLGSGMVLGAVGSALGFVYTKLVIPLFTVFIYASTRFLSLFSGLFRLIFHREVKFYEDESSKSGNSNDLEFDDVGPTHVPDIVVWIFFALLIAAAAFLVVKGLKALAGKNRRFDSKSGFQVSREAIGISPEPRRGLFTRRSERDAVRHQYRRFLKECLDRGFRITKDLDTEEIARAAEEYFPGAPLDELREIYIVARYTDREVTAEEAKEAAELYTRIRKTDITEMEEKR